MLTSSDHEGMRRSEAASLGGLPRFVISIIVVVTAVAGVLRLWDPERWKGVDATSLLYLGVACVALALPGLPGLLRGFKVVKVGTEGITLEQFEQVKTKADAALQRADVAESQAQLSRRVLAERLVKPRSRRLELAPGVGSDVPADPQKGKWGGASVSNGRELKGKVTEIEGDQQWFNVRLVVQAVEGAPPLEGDVVFHLHDTFADQNPVVVATNGRAVLERLAWGAFTVGAEADHGATRLELDLSTLDDAPPLFRSR